MSARATFAATVTLAVLAAAGSVSVVQAQQTPAMKRTVLHALEVAFALMLHGQ